MKIAALRLATAFLAGVLGGVTAFWMGSPFVIAADVRPPKFVPASTFALVDQTGNLHGTWTASENGRSDFILTGSDGKTMVLQIAAGEDGSGSITFYKGGKPEFMMTGKGVARFNQPAKE